MTTSFPIRTIAFVTSDNLAGADLVVQACTDFVGGTEPVTVAPGDVVLGLTPVEGGMTGTAYSVASGEPWTKIQPQPEPGALLCVIGSATGDNVEFQSGMTAFFDAAGRLIPSNSSRLTTLEQTVSFLRDAVESLLQA